MSRLRSSFCLLALALGACHLTTESGNPLVASLTASRLGIGGTIERQFLILVTIVNNGRRDAQIADPASYCGQHLFRVFGPGGREIELPSREVVCTLELRGPVTLPPGQSISFYGGEWTASADLANGDYRVVPKLWGEGGEIPAIGVSVTLCSPCGGVFLSRR